MSAFDWSPGGCCCAVAQGPWAIGVDDINNPTITRIPKKARITYSGVYLNDGPFDFPRPGPTSCGAPDFLNNQVEVFEAFAPSYSFRRDLGDHVGVNNNRLQMHWSTSREDHTEKPTWPGYAGGTPTFDIGRITRKPNSQVNPADAGQPNRVVAASGDGPNNMAVNYNTQFNFLTGWSPYSPAPFRFNQFSESCQIDEVSGKGELTIVAGDFFDFNNPTPFLQVIFTHRFQGTIGLSGFLQPVWWKRLTNEWRLHEFSFTGQLGAPNRRQRIAVIPDSITLTVADSVKFVNGIMENASNAGGRLDRMVINITFEDWFEGPLATLP